MDVETASRTIMKAIRTMKSEIKLSDFGRLYQYLFIGFALLISLSGVSFIGAIFLANCSCRNNCAILLAALATIWIIIQIFNVFHEYANEKNKFVRGWVFRVVFSAGLVISIVFVWTVVKTTEYELYWESLVFFVMSVMTFLFLFIGYTRKPSTKETIEQKRKQRSIEIKRVILGVISGDDTRLEQYESVKISSEEKDINEHFIRNNKTYIGKIVNDRDNPQIDEGLYDRYRSYSAFLSGKIDSEIKRLDDRHKTRDIVAIASLIVTVVVVAVDKFYDAIINYLSVDRQYTFAEEFIDNLPKDEALKLAEDIVVCTIAFFALIAVVAFVFYFVYRVIKGYRDQKDNTYLDNLKYAKSALWDLNQEILSDSDIK